VYITDGSILRSVNTMTKKLNQYLQQVK